ncbi:hypothetical protein [Legionella worsleiensis]|uniref:Transmembrane protein n=1 Tax=Legionella worsleiensis TaxID=45076 RepID=A0A0W1A5Q0_9GAMM|nr:hypothetical protein [Legionella worsleiensis]KTD76671.1 hypothetical protein Lwor_1896 [Legionella worsleiensis]STY30413.1 Uncharacterised protein [Legionella worsleiensis]
MSFCFNSQFLKFRSQYYISETRELIARHKLLAAFTICLLIPELNHIQVIGIPFYNLIAPSVALKVKLIYLSGLVVFLLSLTRAQASFIKGGEFREYLHTVFISMTSHKIIDFIILLLSLNVVWLAVFFGGTFIFNGSQDAVFIVSQYCLYAALIFSLCTLLLNYLYKQIAMGFLNFTVLLLIVVISKQGNSLLNCGVGIVIFLMCCLTLMTIKPVGSYFNYSFKLPRINFFYGLNSIHSLKNIFIIQLAIIRKHRTLMLMRSAFCFVLSLAFCRILISQEIEDNQQGFVLVVMTIQSYILSGLYLLFEKAKSEYKLFHRIFPYQNNAHFLKEIMLICAGLAFALIPVFICFMMNFKEHLAQIFIMFLMNCMVCAINRIFYCLSMQFCLITSLLSTVGCCVVQFFFLGTYYG